jgi:hypothetical protein
MNIGLSNFEVIFIARGDALILFVVSSQIVANYQPAEQL